MHLSDFKKTIYNVYLQALRKNRPFTNRKKFDDLDDEVVVVLKQLNTFFASFPNIKIKDFFDAGFADNEFQPIAFFKTMRAIKTYKSYIDQKLANADEEWVLSFVKESLLFIFSFCKQNSIDVKDYISAVAPSGIPWFIIHLKEFKICLYSILDFAGFDSKLLEYSSEAMQVLGDGFLKDLPKNRTAFFASKKCKSMARNGLELIQTNTNTNKH
jgi:hypothetical protein